MKIYIVRPHAGSDPCIHKDMQDVFEWIKIAAVGDIITIRISEMEESEYNNLPEYDGP